MFKSINIELTNKCNLSCKHCYAYNPKKTTRELSTKMIKKFLFNFSKNNGKHVLLTGGEIFLRKDLKKIIKFCKKNNLTVDIFTNATLIPNSMINFIAKNINYINISLDGPENHHDHFRGKLGSFKKTTKVIEKLSNAGGNIFIQTMMTSKNFNDTKWLEFFLKSFKPKVLKLSHITKLGKGKELENFRLSEEQIYDLKFKKTLTLNHKNNYKSIITTNITNQKECNMFYPEIENTIPIWLKTNGKITFTYGENEEFWGISDVESYPKIIDHENFNLKKEKLLKKVEYKIQNSNLFELFELFEEAAKEIEGEAL